VSIALVSMGATVTLSGVTVVASDAGDGGQGGDPQAGGMGSLGGLGGTSSGIGPLMAGCSGGGGGSGGSGGIGGGGRGGHSIGIASSGTVPVYAPALVSVGMAGLGGPGGVNDVDMNHGASGEAALCFDLTTQMPCP